MKGVVTKIYPDRGFGFIRGEDHVQRFFHARFVLDPRMFDLITVGAEVEFLTRDAEKGEQAYDVKVLANVTK